MPPILAATGLHFLDFLHYPPIAIAQGSMTFVQGPSGCGKSTLLRLFNATATPSAGQVLFDGQGIAGLDTIQLRRDVLLVSQATYLFDDTIEGNF
ncbi:MAG: ATP-binding cassette domain-containing protein, partial [Pygmaiobacter sp.]|nr:ATP-binding cassette domain-containing protein [Pygmaiobacter sp.]